MLSAEKTIEALGEAERTAREAAVLAHEATKDLLAAMKKNRDNIREAIRVEISTQVGELADDTRRRLDHAIDDVITGISNEWRAALHLPPG